MPASEHEWKKESKRQEEDDVAENDPGAEGSGRRLARIGYEAADGMNNRHEVRPEVAVGWRDRRGCERGNRQNDRVDGKKPDGRGIATHKSELNHASRNGQHVADTFESGGTRFASVACAPNSSGDDNGT